MIIQALTFIRNEIKQFFIDTIEIYNVSKTYASDGGTVIINKTLDSTYLGQIVDVSGNEKELISALINAGNESTENIKVLLPYDATVALNQELKTADNKYWNIAQINSSKTLTAALEVLAYIKVNI